MSPRTRSSRTDSVFGALANPARPSVSEHLRVLRDCGLVSERKRGRFRYYQINPDPLQSISAWLSPYERFWRGRLTALGELLDTISKGDES